MPCMLREADGRPGRGPSTATSRDVSLSRSRSGEHEHELRDGTGGA